MSYLEKWLLLYLGEDYGGSVFWRDGERFADVLASVDQVWFSKLRSKMRPRASTSWVFMQGNLKRIMVAIRGYYSRHLGLVLSKEREPVLGLIARVGDQVQLEKMMLLVLGCAVTGCERGKHIRKILSMEKEMKTEILLKVKSLELEVTLLNIKVAGRKSIDICKRKEAFYMRKDSNDSGITLDEDCDDEERLISDIDSVSIVTTADFSCQHDGFFETTFDEHDKNDTSKNERNFIKTNQTEMEDFECQFDSSVHKTSNIIDVDDSLDIADKNDIGTDPCTKLSVDASTDPMFEDSAKIYQLEQQVSELELLLLDKLGKDATLHEYEKEMKKLKKMCGVAYNRYQKIKQELEQLKMVLRMGVEERDNLRSELKQMSDNRNVDERIKDLESKLDSVMSENTNLLENKKTLEDRIWNLELEQKRQSYNSENLLRLQLSCSTSETLRRQMLKMSTDCISSTSSGFASGSETQVSYCGSQNRILALPPYGDNMRELHEEMERLSELIGVMEVREEQLLEEVEEVAMARDRAEEKVKEKEDEILTREQKDMFGRRVKNALLLTAAFGAVHQAIQPELVMGCVPM